MKTGYLVCDVMTQRPISVEHDVPISECAKIMSKYHVSTLIVKKANKLLGLLTEKDIVRKVVADSLDPSKILAREICQTSYPLITPERDIYEAIITMRDKNVRHLPVMEKGKLVGFLTGKDILKIQPQLFEILAEKIELREQERKLSLLK
ncbi:MAG: CBS domain-containing protein [Candidatus Woesearchaeota archaeon]